MLLKNKCLEIKIKTFRKWYVGYNREMVEKYGNVMLVVIFFIFEPQFSDQRVKERNTEPLWSLRTRFT